MTSKAVTSDVIKMKNVRVSFIDALWTPKAFTEGATAKHSATFLLDPNDPEQKAQIDNIVSIAERLKKEKKWGKQRLTGVCYGYADDNGYSYEGWQGMFYVKASNQRHPLVVDNKGRDITEEDGTLYAGCYVHANVTLWTQDNQWGKRINANLRGVMFVKEGDAFAGHTKLEATDEFDEIVRESEEMFG